MPHDTVPGTRPLPRQIAVYQLKITLRDVHPPVWRRLLVPAATTLSTLNHIIQTAMGWTNSHLHRFEAGGIFYQMPDPDFPFEEDQRNERGVRLDQVLTGPGAQGLYVYDFGDDWTHAVLVEKIELPAPGTSPALSSPTRSSSGSTVTWPLPMLPLCLDGARACPPEDCGGPPGYEDLRRTLADPGHPEHLQMLEWVGGPFDPEGFDRNAINRKLAQFRAGGR